MKRRIIRGTTLAEVVMALAVIGTMGGGCYVGFNALNAYASATTTFGALNPQKSTTTPQVINTGTATAHYVITVQNPLSSPTRL